MANDWDESLPWYVKTIMAIAVLVVAFVLVLDLLEFAAVI